MFFSVVKHTLWTLLRWFEEWYVKVFYLPNGVKTLHFCVGYFYKRFLCEGVTRKGEGESKILL